MVVNFSVKRMIKAMKKKPTQTLLMAIIILVFILVNFQVCRRDTQVEKLDFLKKGVSLLTRFSDFLKKLFDLKKEDPPNSSGSTASGSTASSSFSTVNDSDSSEDDSTGSGSTSTPAATEVDCYSSHRFKEGSEGDPALPTSWSFGTQPDTVEKCKRMCLIDPRCGGFTFEKSGEEFDGEGACYESGINMVILDLPPSVADPNNFTFYKKNAEC